MSTVDSRHSRHTSATSSDSSNGASGGYYVNLLGTHTMQQQQQQQQQRAMYSNNASTHQHSTLSMPQGFGTPLQQQQHAYAPQHSISRASSSNAGLSVSRTSSGMEAQAPPIHMLPPQNGPHVSAKYSQQQQQPQQQHSTQQQYFARVGSIAVDTQHTVPQHSHAALPLSTSTSTAQCSGYGSLSQLQQPRPAVQQLSSFVDYCSSGSSNSYSYNSAPYGHNGGQYGGVYTDNICSNSSTGYTNISNNNNSSITDSNSSVWSQVPWEQQRTHQHC
jgi:hypothetical protein